MGPLLRRLGIITATQESVDYGRALAWALSARAALKSIDEVARTQGTPSDLSDKLRAEYHDRLRAAEEDVARLHEGQNGVRARTDRGMRRSLLLVEKEALFKAQQHGLIGSDALRPSRPNSTPGWSTSTGGSGRLSGTAAAPSFESVLGERYSDEMIAKGG